MRERGGRGKERVPAVSGGGGERGRGSMEVEAIGILASS